MSKRDEPEQLHSKKVEKPLESDDWSPFIEYLKSPQGHELASRIVTIIEEVKKATLDRSAEQSKLNVEFTHRHRRNLLILQSTVLGVAILAASLLTYYDKFDSTVAILFGTLVGYFFGRKTTP